MTDEDLESETLATYAVALERAIWARCLLVVGWLSKPRTPATVSCFPFKVSVSGAAACAMPPLP
jgi:hypothetical protein